MKKGISALIIVTAFTLGYILINGEVDNQQLTSTKIKKTNEVSTANASLYNESKNIKPILKAKEVI